nr:phage recombination protein Bet [Solobacterium sp.]
MAVANSITKKPTATQQNAITFTSGSEEIKLTPAMVKAYLVSGDSSNVTDQEITMFMMMCKSNHLNPWNREAYCIKYGTSPATMVVGKDAFLKRAERHPQYDGMTSGIIVVNGAGIEYRQGILKFKDEELLGGWAEVFRKDRTHSSRIEVSFDEYAGRKKDGTLNNQWSTKPATMIRKVA